jgi:raffinose/stachyose/melibiose transport system permease protein
MSINEVAVPRQRRRSWTGRATILLFLAPALALYLIMVLMPIVQAAYYSLFKWNGLEPLTNFVGLQNYIDAFGNDLFQGALSHNVMLVVMSLVIQIPISLGLAIFLSQRFPGRTLFRVLFFLPYVISEVVTGILFYLLLQQDGAVNSQLSALGLDFLVQDWWGNLALVMFTMFFVISWKYFGFHMIILLAGLQGIPREVQEAALIDGCGKFQMFRYITLPLIGPTLRISVFLSIIGAIQLFDMVYATTRGGPVHQSDTLSYYMYDFGLGRQQMGYGSAIAVILFLICFGIALLYQRFVLRRDMDGATTSYVG